MDQRLLGDANEQERERQAHLQLVKGATADGHRPSADEGLLRTIKTAPIFSRRVRCALEDGEVLDQRAPPVNVFPQYGFLGLRDATFAPDGKQDCSPSGEIRDQDMVYANNNAPWSAFICGSQGAGKSHTLSCMLENALLSDSLAGALPNPLAGIVFHYDRFTSYQSTQFCEAAYLCSQGIPVKVLVSPVSLPNMRRLYANLPGLPSYGPRPQVEPLYLSERQLNTANMMKLMAVNDGTRTPLYVDTIRHVLKDMASKKCGGPGIDYQTFKKKISDQGFTKDQTTPLNMRLRLLEGFLKHSADSENIWNFDKGTITIIDLSCPFVNENEACALFAICLSLFMEGRSKAGRIIALDEAHKFLTQSGDAMNFTDQLVAAICQQRHIATRVLIATQEPTLSPRLLDLCTVTIVHRFRSPAWFATLKAHLAGALNTEDNKSASDDVFRTIVGLRTGQALLFCPEAMLDVVETESGIPPARKEVRELKDSFILVSIRQRVTADGGRSVMASDTIPELRPHNERSKSNSLPQTCGVKDSPSNDSEEYFSAQSDSDEASFGKSRSRSSDYEGGGNASDAKRNKNGQASGNVAVRQNIRPQTKKGKSAKSSVPASSTTTNSTPVASASASNSGTTIKKTVSGGDRIRECLQQLVVRSLDKKSSNLDFGEIRSGAAKKLNVSPHELTVRYSNTIIKDACKQYFVQHDIPFPKWVNW